MVDGIEADYGNELQVIRLDFNGELHGDVARDLGVRSHPTTLLVDGDGAIVERFRGPVDREAIQGHLDALLGS